MRDRPLVASRPVRAVSVVDPRSLFDRNEDLACSLPTFIYNDYYDNYYDNHYDNYYDNHINHHGYGRNDGS